MKKYLLLAMLLAGAWFTWSDHDRSGAPFTPVEQAEPPASHTSGAPRSGEQLRGSGEVIRLLADDNDGSRHQRFIIKLDSGRTLLIAHNIDLASRISSLKVGDTVEFYGEYEWNEKGGVIHWTHRDPDGAHVDGWLKHRGRTYQ